MFESFPIKRVVCWYSCGATSALATKLAIEKYAGKYPIVIAYCDTGSEHQDNERFIEDCERWFGLPITILRSEKYADVWEVFDKTRYLAGIKGARCTTELKKLVRNEFQDVCHDLQIFGFDASEQKRADRFCANNNELRVEFPLLEHGYKKQDALDALMGADIELPVMYKLGYKNNNCVGCVKGQAGYWNKIRKDFPEVFKRMAKVERELDVALCKSYAGDGKRKRVFLDELPPDMGRYESELETMKCGLVCGE